MLKYKEALHIIGSHWVSIMWHTIDNLTPCVGGCSLASIAEWFIDWLSSLPDPSVNQFYQRCSLIIGDKHFSNQFKYFFGKSEVWLCSPLYSFHVECFNFCQQTIFKNRNQFGCIETLVVTVYKICRLLRNTFLGYLKYRCYERSQVDYPKSLHIGTTSIDILWRLDQNFTARKKKLCLA